jgi:hypothetical protein
MVSGIFYFLKAPWIQKLSENNSLFYFLKAPWIQKLRKNNSVYPKKKKNLTEIVCLKLLDDLNYDHFSPLYPSLIRKTSYLGLFQQCLLMLHKSSLQWRNSSASSHFLVHDFTPISPFCSLSFELNLTHIFCHNDMKFRSKLTRWRNIKTCFPQSLSHMFLGLLDMDGAERRSSWSQYWLSTCYRSSLSTGVHSQPRKSNDQWKINWFIASLTTHHFNIHRMIQESKESKSNRLPSK